jgi:ABC-type oligopeptide transport system substrate-binding subunit
MSATYEAKGKAKQFLKNLFDLDSDVSLRGWPDDFNE